MKKILKNRIFIFVLGLFIASSISVLAATYFESSAVTYDNKESGLTSTDVQGAIDELYNACKTPAVGGDEILEKVDIVTSGDGLYKDEYEEGRYFYKGANPNNYVTFNNEMAGWRIISIESDKTIKIMRIASIGEIKWDEGGSNNWAGPATLNTYLNSTYLNNQLNEVAKDQIVASNFSIGKVTYGNNNMSTQINNENSNKWYGKVALPTLSEYIRTNSNKSRCGTFNLMNSNYSSCVSTGWMDYNNYWWTLSPHSGNSYNAYYVNSRGRIEYGDVDYSYGYGVHPTIYLSSNIKITGGDGSQNNPYRFE